MRKIRNFKTKREIPLLLRDCFENARRHELLENAFRVEKFRRFFRMRTDAVNPVRMRVVERGEKIEERSAELSDDADLSSAT